MKNRVPQEESKPRTYIIRGQEVMLDRDLAQIFGIIRALFKRLYGNNRL